MYMKDISLSIVECILNDISVRRALFDVSEMISV